jgi:hypothetical protein
MYFSASTKSFSPTVIWPDCRSISNVLYNEVTEQLQRGRVLMADANGDPYTIEPVIIPIVYTLDETFDIQYTKLSLEYEQTSEFLRQGYPKSECDTWTLQVEEAGRFIDWVTAGSIGEHPKVQFLYSLWIGRQQGGILETLPELVSKVIYNNNIYTPILALITGHRHSIERELRLAKATGSKSNVLAVTWNFMEMIAQASK